MEPLTLIQGRQQRLSQSFRAPSTADPTYLISPVAIHEAAGGIRGLFGGGGPSARTSACELVTHIRRLVCGYWAPQAPRPFSSRFSRKLSLIR